MMSETKLDNSFPDGQLLIEGYSKPYKIDRNCNGGGMMLYNSRYSIKSSAHRVIINGRFFG